jgi:UDP-glucuronate decarboxylase
VSTAKGNGRSAGKSRSLSAAPLAARPVLVCGGAGFLGSHLCARLLAQGQHVICVDNFCTSEEDTIESLVAHPKFQLLRRDVASLQEDELGPLGAIFNLACAASPVHYQRSPLDTLFTSIRGMDNLLRMARRCKARIFQASTSEIYGHPTMHPQTEQYWGHVNPIGPRSCYDEGKRCAETLCFIYQQQYGVQVRIARIFNTYGPGMRLSDGRVVINFIVQALADEPITLYGDGTQTRSFCYVDDLVEGFVRFMAQNENVGPMNLGNPGEFTMLELAEKTVRLVGGKSRIVHKPLPSDDPKQRQPDITLARRVLKWEPTIPLDEGLKRTIEYFRGKLAS